MRTILIFLLSLAPFAAEEFALCGGPGRVIDKRYVLYLMSIRDIDRAIDSYLKIYEIEKKHDFELLEQICYTLLEIGGASGHPEDQLLTLFGISLSQNSKAFLHFLEGSVKSPFPEVQAAAIQILSQIYEDRTDDVLAVGLRSSFLQIRFETLFYLVQRKSVQSLGQIESLANLLPPQAKPYFVEFYAMHGSVQAIQILKQLLNDPDRNVRITALLYSAVYQRDDLLPNIRSSLTDSDPLIKEAAAFSIGYLRDLHSVETLKRIAESPFPETRLAALLSLVRLGHLDAREGIFALAEKGNLFAIQAMQEIPGSDALLETLLTHSDSTIALNATMALLKRKNPKIVPHLITLLQTDIESIGFSPHTSPGRSFVCWRRVSPGSLGRPELKNNLKAVSLHFQEELLAASLELPKNSFLQLVKTLMQGRQTRLIPLIVRLLENEGSEETKALLVEKAYSLEHPLLRSYCKLALYRMHINDFYRTEFLKWLTHQKTTRMIEFRPMLEHGAREDKQKGNYTLTPEEISGLFIEAFDALASNHDPEGIAFLLESLREGHNKNRYAFAGLLLKSIH